MPLLSSQFLQKHRELRLAHLALSMMTMGYTWQEGEKDTVEVPLCHSALTFVISTFHDLCCFAVYNLYYSSSQKLPHNLAVPFWEVSQRLGLPPILTHADAALANWRKKDPQG